MNLTQCSVLTVDANGSVTFSPAADFFPDHDRARPEAITASKPASAHAHDADLLTVTEACYRVRQLCWSITGTARAGAGQPLVIMRATCNADGSVRVGSTIGTVTVGPDGGWEFRQSGVAQMPDGATYVHVATLQGCGRSAPLSIVF